MDHSHRQRCCWSTILSVVNWSGKMSVHERTDIEYQGAEQVADLKRSTGRCRFRPPPKQAPPGIGRAKLRSPLPEPQHLLPILAADAPHGRW